MPANTNLPPRPSPEAVRQARHLLTNPQDYTELPPEIWGDLQHTAWSVLHIERQHRTAPVVLFRPTHIPGDAA